MLLTIVMATGAFARLQADSSDIDIIHTQVIACYPSHEIDIFAMQKYLGDQNNSTINIIEQPKYANHISGLNSNQKLPYFPQQDFLGRDSLQFQVISTISGEITANILLYVTVIPCPDNIIKSDCYGTVSSDMWGIDEENYLRSDERINAYGQPYVGDVDGCGRNEVLVWNIYGGNGSSWGAANAILIFDDSLKLKYTIPLGSQTGANSSSPPDLALAFAKTKPENKAADIFVIVGTSTTSPNGAIRSYEFTGSTWTQKWNTPAQLAYSAAINIGDINNDGNIMLYADYKIFNASTGALLLTLPSNIKGKRNGSAAIMNVLVDMDNDGRLEAVVASKVFKLNITNPDNANGNSYEILYELPLSAIPNVHPDGYVSVADVNLDGYLDVIVSTNTTNLTTQRPRLFVWNTQTNPPSLIGDTIAAGYYADPAVSRVFAGDVDGCGRPELVCATKDRLFCYKWDIIKNRFVEKWRKTVTDPSGMTYMCMFDFNHDNKQEIVYRDEQRLRIINGETGTALSEIPCYSSTVWEGPVVVDLNRDGHAQIVVSGNSVSASTFDQTYLRMYTSSVPGSWAPARPVWNQYSYNSVNINDDLSVPRYQMNPSTVFPNGKRPYNSFLKQQTMLNVEGEQFWGLPTLEWKEKPTMTQNDVSVTIVGKIINTGDLGYQAPIYITFYKNSLHTDNIIKLDSITSGINAKDVADISFTIDNNTVCTPISKIYMRINDKNGEFPYKKVCKPIGYKEFILTDFNPGKTSIVWTPEENNTAGVTNAQKQNWNNAANWTPKVVPTACHNVFIPGNSSHYPVLSNYVECNDIYFMQGGELGRPDLLIYNKAHIQLNFGLWQEQQIINRNDTELILKSSSSKDRMLYSASVSNPLERERWIALSAPLRGIVTGDLNFGGFPLTFMKKFVPTKKDNVQYAVGEWTTPYTSFSESFAPTEGFGFYMYGFDPSGDEKRNLGCDESGSYNTLNDLTFFPDKTGNTYGISQTNGILELPFFTDSLGLDAHRTQKYDEANNLSSFYYVFNGSAGVFNALTGTEEPVYRETFDGNFRFITENRSSGNWKFENPILHDVTDLAVDHEFMVGNPYMSSIDMIEFYRDNKESIDSEFHIWNGKNFDTHLIDLENDTVISPGPKNMRYIAPMQGFFLTYKGGDVIFDVEKISTVRPSNASSNLRSASVERIEENALRIKAENMYVASYAIIGHKPGAAEGFTREQDVQKLFSPYWYIPEVYLMADGIPVDIRYIDNAVERIVPIGLKTELLGNITLTLTGMDNYNTVSEIILTDTKLNREMDISGLPSFTYSFDNQTSGIKNDRFYLRFVPSITSQTPIPEEEYIRIYTQESDILIQAPSFDPIREIRVFDLQGRLIFGKSFTEEVGNYRIPHNSNDGCVIVRVKTKDRVKNQKVMVAAP